MEPWPAPRVNDVPGALPPLVTLPMTPDLLWSVIGSVLLIGAFVSVPLDDVIEPMLARFRYLPKVWARWQRSFCSKAIASLIGVVARPERGRSVVHGSAGVCVRE